MTNIDGIKLLCSFIPYFENLDPDKAYRFKGGDKRKNGTITIGYYEYDKEFIKFIDAFYESKLSVEDYQNELNARVPDWQTADMFKVIETDDLELIRIILTKGIRVERFHEGAWANYIKIGLFLAILRRLEALQADMEGL